MYLEYEPESEKYGGDIYRKWCDAVQHVETEYSQFCTDKEFLVPNSLTCCISFLEDNNDYVTAESVVYQLYDNIKTGYELVPWQNVPSVTDVTSEERLKTALNRVTGALFSTYRTTQHKTIYQNLIEYQINDIRFGETAIEIQPLLLGKIKKYHESSGRVRDITHLKAKSLISNIDTSESSFTRYPRIEEYPQELATMLLQNLQKCCVSIVQSQDKNAENIEKIVSKIFTTRYKSGISIFDNSKVVRSLWNKIPLPTQRKIKQIIGMGDLVFTPGNLGNEIKVIIDIVENTMGEYNSDTPISLDNLCLKE